MAPTLLFEFLTPVVQQAEKGGAMQAERRHPNWVEVIRVLTV